MKHKKMFNGSLYTLRYAEMCVTVDCKLGYKLCKIPDYLNSGYPAYYGSTGRKAYKIMRDHEFYLPKIRNDAMK
jgi:hypothetical protein